MTKILGLDAEKWASMGRGLAIAVGGAVAAKCLAWFTSNDLGLVSAVAIVLCQQLANYLNQLSK